MAQKNRILGGLIMGALILTGVGCLNKNKEIFKPPLTTAADIQIADQNLEPDNRLNISKIVTPVDGWISIHAVNDAGLIGDAIGVTQVSMGESKNTKVIISDKTRLTQNLAAMLRHNKGEKNLFELDKDGPVIIDQQVIMRKFTILNFTDVK
ncbi:MAG: hypothetical protein AAB348_03345 [Patescibacteria group bacterium]